MTVTVQAPSGNMLTITIPAGVRTGDYITINDPTIPQNYTPPPMIPMPIQVSA